MAVLSIKDFPDELYRKLKIQAATDGETLRDYVIAALGQHTQGKEQKLTRRLTPRKQ